MPAPRILIACVGNIFLGDDAFGVEVAARLAKRSFSDEVRVVDFGIRGLDLTYALLEGYESVILVDATPRGDQPGTVYLIQPQFESQESGQVVEPFLETHNFNPMQVFRLVQSMGGHLANLLIVGCEPEPLADADEMHMGLSPAVQGALEEAVRMIETLVADMLSRHHPARNQLPNAAKVIESGGAASS